MNQKPNRLVFRPAGSIAGTVARQILRAEQDPLFLRAETTAHLAAWCEQGAHYHRMCEATAADLAVMELCGKLPGAARCLASADAVMR